MTYEKEFAEYVNDRWKRLDKEPITKLLDVRSLEVQAVLSIVWERDFCKLKLTELRAEVQGLRDAKK